MSINDTDCYCRLKPEFRDKYREPLETSGGAGRWHQVKVERNAIDRVSITPVTNVTLAIPASELVFSRRPFTFEDGVRELAIDDATRGMLLNNEFNWEGFSADSPRVTLPIYAVEGCHAYVRNPYGTWRLPVYRMVPPDTDEGILFLDDAAVARLIALCSLNGSTIRITGAIKAMRQMGFQSLLDVWMRVGGYFDVVVDGVDSSEGSVCISERWVPLDNLTWRRVPSHEEGELFVFRHYMDNGVPLGSGCGTNPWQNFHVMAFNRMMRGSSTSAVFRHPQSTTDDDGFCKLGLAEARRLTAEEMDHFRKAITPPALELGELEEALGPVLRDLIRQYPTARATRGLVFARTETALTDEDKDYDAIVAKLCKHPGKLGAIRGLKSIKLPKDMVLRCQAQVDTELGFLKTIAEAPPTEPPNPLQSLDDGDLVRVKVKASRAQTRNVTEVRNVTHDGYVTIPAVIVKQGKDAIHVWLSSDGSRRWPRISDEGEWESIRDGGEEEGDGDIESVDCGEMDKYVPEEEEVQL